MQERFIKIEKSIVNAFSLLDIKPLEMLDGGLIYSHNYKNEMIDELNLVFNKIKASGLKRLTVKPSKCNYCYPTANTYSFHNPINDEFIIRYVIHQESEKSFRVEECKNRVLPNGKDGMPF